MAIFTDYQGFYNAAKNGSINLLRSYVSAGANVHADNDLALRYAADFGQTESVEFLLGHGAYIHAANDAALRWSAFFGDTATVCLLLSKGAGTKKTKVESMCNAVLQNHYDTVELFLQNGVDPNSDGGLAFQWAKRYNYLKIVELLESYVN